MPENCPPDTDVTIQDLDEDLWLVKRIRPSNGVKVVAIPFVEKLTTDHAREAEELRIVQSVSRRLPEPE